MTTPSPQPIIDLWADTTSAADVFGSAPGLMVAVRPTVAGEDPGIRMRPILQLLPGMDVEQVMAMATAFQIASLQAFHSLCAIVADNDPRGMQAAMQELQRRLLAHMQAEQAKAQPRIIVPGVKDMPSPTRLADIAGKITNGRLHGPAA